MEFVSHSPEETAHIATRIAREIDSLSPTTHARVIALEGELGAGKTTFVQAFVKALNIPAPVKSPTFLLIKKYPHKNGGVYHIDCYRIANSQELVPLEIQSILSNPDNIVLIEWSERITEILPAPRTIVHIDHLDPHTRQFTISEISS